MFRKGFVLFCLLIASLMATTTLHARELPGALVITCSGIINAEPENDSKPKSGETEKGAVHQHGCHSASSFLNAVHPVSRMTMSAIITYALPRADALGSLRVGPDLRPPIA